MDRRIVSSISQLLEALTKEACQPSRYPVRFIFVNGFEVWEDLSNKLLQSYSICKLSKACRGEDTLPDKEMIFQEVREALKASDDGRVVLLPVGEILRLKETAFPLLEFAVLQLESSQKRVIVPILWPPSIVLDELRKIDRYRQSIIPYWELESAGSVDLRIVNKNIPSPTESTEIAGIRNYLQLWENGGSSEVTLATEYASQINSIKGEFNVTVFNSAFEIIKNRCPTLELKESWGKEANWKWFLAHYEDNISLRENILRLLNMNTYDQMMIVSSWQNFTNDQKWLALILAKLVVKIPGDMLDEVLRNAVTQKDLILNIILLPFSRELVPDEIALRVDILNKLGVTNNSQEFWNSYRALETPLLKLKALAGITNHERSEILNCVKILLETGVERRKWLVLVEKSFPDLYIYLSVFPFEDPFVREYMKAYANSRVCDTISPELSEFTEEWYQKNFYLYNTRNSVLEKYSSSSGTIHWIDGFGLEWAPLLQKRLQEKGLKVDLKIARASLPTTTEVNKIDNGKLLSNTIDNIAHHKPYGKFPKAFLKVFIEIDELTNSITELSSFEPRVVVTADHGLTRFAAEEKKISVPNGYSSHYYGRYSKKESENAEPVAEDDGDWLVDDDNIILKGHSIFQGGSKASGEVHGGATLEESLVPVLVITHVEGIPCIRECPDSLFLSPSENTYLRIVLSEPVVESVNLLVKSTGNFIQGEKSDSLSWDFLLDVHVTGKYSMEVSCERGIIGAIKINISKGIMENDMGL